MKPLCTLLIALLVLGCSVRKMALNMVAGSLGSASAFETEGDLELAGEALPFGLKLMESMAREVTDNPELYGSLSQGFLLYAYGYIEPRSERLKDTDVEEHQRQRTRAKAIYARSHDYAIQGLAAANKGFRRNYPADPAKAMAALNAKQVGLLYAAGTSLAKWSTIEKLDPRAMGRLSLAVNFIRRALDLDPTFDCGSLYEFMAAYEGRPPAMGGNPAKAMEYCRKAMTLAEDRKVSARLTFVETFAIPNQDRKAFRDHIERILAFDLDSSSQYKLVNTLAQNRARLLLQRESELFVEEDL